MLRHVALRLIHDRSFPPLPLAVAYLPPPPLQRGGHGEGEEFFFCLSAPLKRPLSCLVPSRRSLGVVGAIGYRDKKDPSAMPYGSRAVLRFA